MNSNIATAVCKITHLNLPKFETNTTWPVSRQPAYRYSTDSVCQRTFEAGCKRHHRLVLYNTETWPASIPDNRRLHNWEKFLSL